MPRRLDMAEAGFEAGFRDLLGAKREADQDVGDAVAAILAAVRTRGDAALVDYTKKFDRLDVTPDELRVGEAELDAAELACPSEALAALDFAAVRIEAFHARQKPENLDFQDEHGVRLGHRWNPVAAAGLYVPGGTAAYPSTVLMNALPARVAGVERVAMVVPAPDGLLNPLVLAAARRAGVTEVYRVGGAQAIGALAYGTETISPVDKIVGPGNAYVATAKRLVFGAVGIDMIAGPSEVVVVCDGKTRPDWVAMDLFAQAEHDEEARAMLISPDREFLDRVQEAIDELLPGMPRAEIIASSLASRGAFIHTSDLDSAAALVNRLAPEHLELSVEDPEAMLPGIRHAGAIFLGRYAAEALGDYCAGPNHVLPTATTARFSSPLGVYDFQKRSSIIGCSAEAAAHLAPVAAELARGEGLHAHARSAELRGRPRRNAHETDPAGSGEHG